MADPPKRLESQSFTSSYSGLSNVLENTIAVCQAYGSEKKPNKYLEKEYKAIWDTGATGSVITKKVVLDLGLKSVAMTQMKTAGGVVDSPVYIVSIKLPNKVRMAFVKVSQADDLGGSSDILIGMDIIATGDFAVTNIDGKTVFSFRWPSLERIDFVKETKYGVKTRKILSNRELPTRIRPNDQCPCGSGKKFKNCCRNK